MRKTLVRGLVGAVLTMVACAGLPAATLYDNGLPNGLGGNAMTDFLQADDFTLGALSNLTAVRFFNTQFVPADYFGSIYWAIYTNNAGAPGTVIGSGLATPVRAVFGGGFQNDFNINVPNVAAGTYWLGLHNGPLTNTGFTDFYWSWADGNATVAGMEMSLDPPELNWSTNGQEHAFAIFGDVQGPPGIPEPGTAFLALSGLAAAMLTRLRKKS